MAQVSITVSDLTNGQDADADVLRALLVKLQNAANSIDATQLNAGCVGTTQIADGAVTEAKLAAMWTGIIAPFGTDIAPTGWLACDGTAVSRSTYSALFGVIVPTVGTVTITIATPGVVTKVAHGLKTGSAVYLTTTDTLPTGLAVNTLYYVIKNDADTFWLATSYANAVAGTPTKIATSVSQAGTHTMKSCPWGLGDGSTTFNVPDVRDLFLRGISATRATGMASEQASQNLAHTHSVTYNPDLGGNIDGVHDVTVGSALTATTTGSSGGTEARPRNIGVPYYIKT
jgi:microcystin-dependent protein